MISENKESNSKNKNFKHKLVDMIQRLLTNKDGRLSKESQTAVNTVFGVSNMLIGGGATIGLLQTLTRYFTDTHLKHDYIAKGAAYDLEKADMTLDYARTIATAKNDNVQPTPKIIDWQTGEECQIEKTDTVTAHAAVDKAHKEWTKANDIIVRPDYSVSMLVVIAAGCSLAGLALRRYKHQIVEKFSPYPEVREELCAYIIKQKIKKKTGMWPDDPRYDALYGPETFEKDLKTYAPESGWQHESHHDDSNDTTCVSYTNPKNPRLWATIHYNQQGQRHGTSSGADWGDSELDTIPYCNGYAHGIEECKEFTLQDGERHEKSCAKNYYWYGKVVSKTAYRFLSAREEVCAALGIDMRPPHLLNTTLNKQEPV